jgi:uncharacterized protein (DUF302 family)
MDGHTFTVECVTVIAEQSFEEVTRRVEAHAGRSDLARVGELLASGASGDEIRWAIEAMAGPSGLMIFDQFDHGRLLALAGQQGQARLYILGNPLIALQMTRHDVRAGLYAPWRLLVYRGGDGKVRLTYERPTALLGRFEDPHITEVARGLEGKLQGLVDAAK